MKWMRRRSQAVEKEMVGTWGLEPQTSTVSILRTMMEGMRLSECKLHAINALALIERHSRLVRVAHFSKHLDGLARQGYVTKHGTNFAVRLWQSDTDAKRPVFADPASGLGRSPRCRLRADETREGDFSTVRHDYIYFAPSIARSHFKTLLPSAVAMSIHLPWPLALLNFPVPPTKVKLSSFLSTFKSSLRVPPP
jgi:hypothetical protein